MRSGSDIDLLMFGGVVGSRKYFDDRPQDSFHGIKHPTFLRHSLFVTKWREEHGVTVVIGCRNIDALQQGSPDVAPSRLAALSAITTSILFCSEIYNVTGVAASISNGEHLHLAMT